MCYPICGRVRCFDFAQEKEAGETRRVFFFYSRNARKYPNEGFGRILTQALDWSRDSRRKYAAIMKASGDSCGTRAERGAKGEGPYLEDKADRDYERRRGNQPRRRHGDDLTVLKRHLLKRIQVQKSATTKEWTMRVDHDDGRPY